MGRFRERELEGKVHKYSGRMYWGRGCDIWADSAEWVGWRDGAHLGASGLLIGGDTHSSQSFITGHSGPLISSLIVSGPSLLSTCNFPHPLAFKGWQQMWLRGRSEERWRCR